MTTHEIYARGKTWNAWNPAKTGPLGFSMEDLVNDFVAIIPVSRHEARVAITAQPAYLCECSVCQWVSVLGDFPL